MHATKRLERLLFLALIVMWSSGPGLSQEIREGDQAFADQVSVGYVLVPVVVRSESGYVKGLSQDDFHLSVDGETVAIESFEVGNDTPISVVFLQDLSGSMANAGKLGLSRLAIDRLLHKAQLGDQFALATFNNGALRVDIPFTTDTNKIDQAMGQWQPFGVTALHDAVWGLPELTKGMQSAVRAAVLITDGADNSSHVGPNEARNHVRQAELPVYVLGLETGDPQILDQEGNKLHRYADIMNLLAHLSGGQYFSISEISDAIMAAISISDDLRHQYVLGFATTGEGDLQYREIEVTTRKKKLKLTFRRGYEGPAPKAGPYPAL